MSSVATFASSSPSGASFTPKTSPIGFPPSELIGVIVICTLPARARDGIVNLYLLPSAPVTLIDPPADPICWVAAWATSSRGLTLIGSLPVTIVTRWPRRTTETRPPLAHPTFALTHTNSVYAPTRSEAGTVTDSLSCARRRRATRAWPRTITDFRTRPLGCAERVRYAASASEAFFRPSLRTVTPTVNEAPRAIREGAPVTLVTRTAIGLEPGFPDRAAAAGPATTANGAIASTTTARNHPIMPSTTMDQYLTSDVVKQALRRRTTYAVGAARLRGTDDAAARRRRCHVDDGGALSGGALRPLRSRGTRSPGNGEGHVLAGVEWPGIRHPARSCQGRA